ncbi:unnamed protein product [Linum tenue]|uniref:Uncharacterized protein n=1 Tax=Linum tenue TaxID=586396 RepID=A0AAV0L735_9ROSI|nr:unnamed protein product [Linum tenue]
MSKPPPCGYWCGAYGYYNGAIKTRKTVQPVEVTAEEASLNGASSSRSCTRSLLSTGEQAAAKGHARRVP